MNPRLAVSRRSVLRVLASTASLFALEGCASMAGTGARFDAAELTTNPTLLVATTRYARSRSSGERRPQASEWHGCGADRGSGYGAAWSPARTLQRHDRCCWAARFLQHLLSRLSLGKVAELKRPRRHCKAFGTPFNFSEHGRGNFDAECPGGLEVDHQLELGLRLRRPRTGSTTARSVHEVALIRDTVSPLCVCVNRTKFVAPASAASPNFLHEERHRSLDGEPPDRARQRLDDAEHIRARVCRDGRGGSQGHRRCAQGLAKVGDENHLIPL
jgi:hypothetical protein